MTPGASPHRGPCRAGDEPVSRPVPALSDGLGVRACCSVVAVIHMRASAAIGSLDPRSPEKGKQLDRSVFSAHTYGCVEKLASPSATVASDRDNCTVGPAKGVVFNLR